MVDKVRSLEPGKSIVASKTLDASEELFQDHFPGFPVVPGVLLTEMMAQAGGKCLFSEDPERGYPVLVRVKDASFRSWVGPGQEIELRAEVSTSAKAYATAKCHGAVEGKTICNADLFYAFLPAEQLGPGAGLPDIFSTEVENDGD
jgi:3-hydroxyacyl-[acyl-carrier-protein] dehydratase